MILVFEMVPGVCVRSKYMQLLGIQLLISYGIVAKRPRCELGLHFAGCFITKTRKKMVLKEPLSDVHAISELFLRW